VTLQEFANAHHLPQNWLELRNGCEQLLRNSDFWYRIELKDQARKLATEASDILSGYMKSKNQERSKEERPVPDNNVQSASISILRK
jgi:hypothetical protein